MATTFTVITRTLHPVEDVFDISLEIETHTETFASTREQAIAGTTTGSIRLGENVTWRGRHFGIWFKMTVEIDQMDRPHSFSDRQVKGPFNDYRHAHEFTRQGEATWILDHVTIDAPIFGRLIERSVLAPHLRKLIIRRNKHLLELLDQRRAAVDSERPGGGQ